MSDKRGALKIFTILLLGLFFINLFSGFVSAADGSIFGDSDRTQILNNLADSFIVRILFGDINESLTADYKDSKLNSVSIIIIHLAFWLMIFVAFSDIFSVFLPFKNKYVPWIVGGAFSVIVANLGLIPWFIIWMAEWTAWLGSAAIFISMAIAFVAFIAVTFFGNVWRVKILRQKAEEGKELTVAGFNVAKKVGEGLTR